MIDAVEAILELAAKNSDLMALIENRLSTLHRFGDEWEAPSKALAIRMDSGNVDIYIPWQVPRLEVRCFGESFHEASLVYQSVVAWLRTIESRQVIETSEGEGLIYYMVQRTAPVMLVEPDVMVPLYLFFCEAAVAELEIGG